MQTEIKRVPYGSTFRWQFFVDGKLWQTYKRKRDAEAMVAQAIRIEEMKKRDVFGANPDYTTMVGPSGRLVTVRD